MNEGMPYRIENPECPNDNVVINAEKSAVLARIATAGFVSHMELIVLTDDQTPNRSANTTSTALFELEESGDIERSYETTDQQNVIIGYQLPQ